MAVGGSPAVAENPPLGVGLKAETSQPSSLTFFPDLPPPPSFVLWITVAVALGTFLWRVILFVVDRFDKRRERDEYWYRTIVFPICIDPLLKHINELTASIWPLDKEEDKTKRNEEYMKFLNEFKTENGKVINRFLILSEKNKSTYQAVASALDDVDDIITQHCACNALGTDNVIDSRKYANPSVVEQEIFSRFRELFEILKSLHRGTFRS